MSEVVDIMNSFLPESARPSYGSRSTTRGRRTKAEMSAIRKAIFYALRADHPQTIRQLFYRLTVEGVIAKTEPEYKSVVRLTGEMRRAGDLPFQWIADSTRWMRKPTTYDSVESALQITAQTYRRSLWAETTDYVEVWIEKEALAGVVVDVTDEFDVPLMVTRGYPSLSFVQAAAEAMNARRQLTYVYYLGDYDPSGVDISRKLEEDLKKFTCGEIDTSSASPSHPSRSRRGVFRRGRRRRPTPGPRSSRARAWSSTRSRHPRSVISSAIRSSGTSISTS